MVRYLNSFVLIGVALIAVSLAGFATGGRFLTEPGQTPGANMSLIYLGTGVLMIINGVVSARTALTPASNTPKAAAENAAATDKVPS